MVLVQGKQSLGKHTEVIETCSNKWSTQQDILWKGELRNISYPSMEWGLLEDQMENYLVKRTFRPWSQEIFVCSGHCPALRIMKATNRNKESSGSLVSLFQVSPATFCLEQSYLQIRHCNEFPSLATLNLFILQGLWCSSMSPVESPFSFTRALEMEFTNPSNIWYFASGSWVALSSLLSKQYFVIYETNQHK